MSALAAGEAYVDVAPSFKGFFVATDKASTKAAKSAAAQFNSQMSRGIDKPSLWKSAGSKMAHGIGSAFKTGLKLTVGGALTLLGYSLVKGFQRLSAIDQAKHKLSGLGNSAKQVDGIMKSALASVKGTAFGLDAAATVAASAVAAGVKPGKDLTRTLSLTADAATIAGTSMDDMGAIFNKVATSNKVQGDVINQLSQRGIPIVQLLGKSLHKSSAEVVDLARKGKINFAQFQTAMEQGVGGAAKKSGDTFTGAFANLKASLSRIGAGLLGGIFPQLAPQLQAITKAMGPLEDSAGSLGDKFGKVLAKGLAKIPPLIANLQRDWRELKSGFLAGDLGPGETKWQRLGGIIKRLSDALKGKDIGGTFGKITDAVKRLGAGLRGVNIEQVFESLGKSAPIFNSALTITGKVLQFAADHAGTFAKWLPLLLAGFVAWKAAQAANNVLGSQSVIGYNLRTAALFATAAASLVAASATRAATRAQVQATGATNAGILASVRQKVATLAGAVAQRAMSAAARIAAAGQWLLNAAMSANPIALVILGLIALGVAFVVLWKKSQTFRNIVTGAWNGIKSAALAVGNWFTKTLWPALKGFFSSMGSAFAATGRAISGTWDKIKGAFSSAWNWVSGFFRAHWQTILGILTGPVGIAVTQIIKHWGSIKAAFSAAWSWVRGAFSRSWNGVKTVVMAPINAVHGLLNSQIAGWKRLFTNARDSIGKIWGAVKALFEKPITATINFLGSHFSAPINSILNKVGLGKYALPTKFAAGGIMPGYTPGRDVHRFYSPTGGALELSGGEAIMRPEVTRALGVGAVNAMNAAARSGGIGGVRKFLGGQGFAGGGIWGGIKGAVGGALDWVKDAAEIITNPKKIIDKLLGTLGSSWPATVARAALGNLWQGFKGLLGVGDGPGVPGGGRRAPKSGLAWSGIEWYRPAVLGSLKATLRNLQRQGWSILEMPGFGAVHRVHSRNSLHYLGQAADISFPGMRGGDGVARMLAALGYGTKWRVPGHFNHIHVDTSILDHMYGRWSHVPGYASGGVARPGLVRVGERGPELLQLGSTSRIYSNSEVRRMSGGPVRLDPRDIKLLAHELRAGSAEGSYLGTAQFRAATARAALLDAKMAGGRP